MTPLLLPSLVGATGSAKTALACLLAREVGLEVLGADSRQLYRGFDVGTAKPTREERAAVPHHLIDVADPRDTYSAARFGEEARRLASDIRSRGGIPLLVGGSGLYVRAAEEGLFEGPSADIALRGAWEERARREGPGVLHAELALVDPQSAARLAANDVVRVVRALEVFALTGVTLSTHHERHQGADAPVRPMRFALVWEPEVLARRLRDRSAFMLESGWVEEVRSHLEGGLSDDAPAWNALGYREVREFARGERSKAETLDRIAVATRRYAKRQGTWFRSVPETRWFAVAGEADLPRIAGEIAAALREDAESSGP